jgi:hypothetical protein
MSDYFPSETYARCLFRLSKNKPPNNPARNAKAHMFSSLTMFVIRYSFANSLGSFE